MWWVVGGGVGSRCSVVGGGWWVGMRALPLIGGGEGAGGFVIVHAFTSLLSARPPLLTK